MSSTPGRRVRRFCDRRGHTSPKYIDGELFCTDCKRWIEVAQDDARQATQPPRADPPP